MFELNQVQNHAMAKQQYYLIWVFPLLIFTGCNTEKQPYKVVDNYIFVQNENRRNDSTEWQLVWEDNFDNGFLDTTHWTRIGLFTSPQWKLPVERWREHTGCFRYISATDDRVVQFDDENIFLRGIVNEDTINGDPRPYLTGGIYTWGKFAFQYGRIEMQIFPRYIFHL